MIRDLAYAGSVRALVCLVAVGIACGCELDDTAPGPPPSPAATARAKAADTARASQECRDTCDETNVLAGGGDDALRACRERCDARFGTAAPPYEVPTKIIQGKAVHAPPLVKPIVR
jgi:hypothetical protein